jgi:hypothetical protein
MATVARTSTPRLEQLDDRITPSVGIVTRANTGTAGVTATLAAFEGDITAAIGGVNNGGGAATTNGFRTINWDGVGLGATDGAFTNQVITPNHTVGIPVNRFQARGVIFEDIYAVTDTGFATENPGAAGQFTPFSPTKIFAMFDDNGIELHFTVPGSTTPAGSLGFGAVFLDVEKANTTSIEYFNGTTSLGKFFVPVAPSGQPSFFGATFAQPVVTRVELTLGDATLFSVDKNTGTVTAGPADVSNGGTADLVATDDFVYAEPQVYSAPPNGQALVVSGQTNGTAAVIAPTPPTHVEEAAPDPTGGLAAVPAVVTKFGSTPTATLKPFGDVAASVRTAAADVDGDGIADTVLVTGPGVPVRFAAISGKDNTTVLIPPTDPFGGDFTGGGFIAAADLDADGKAEVLVSPDQGGGPRVVVFSMGAAGASPAAPTVRASFNGIDDPAFRGGARVAVGDVNHDGTPDLAVAAGFLGGPRVALFDGKTVLATPTRLVGDFFAFPGADATTLRNGAFVALGDVDGDGFADVIAGGGPGGSPRVLTISGKTLTGTGTGTGPEAAQAAPLMNFFVANNSADRGGVRVAALNADGDNRADVAAGSGEGSPSKVRVYLGADITSSAEPAAFQDVDPFAATLPGGVFVG